MTKTAERAAQSVFRAIESFNASESAVIPRSVETVLLGSGGAVDSLGLVRLILVVERQLEEDLGVALSLTDEKALSQRNSPFHTVGTLIHYITACLNESA